MKTTILALLFLFTVGAFAQTAQVAAPESFYPRTLTAGTQMSARTAATTLDDTTRALQFRGYAAAFIGLETATNDSASPIIWSYQVSKDGSAWSPLIVGDSANFLTVVGGAKYFQLPANAMGAYAVRIRVYGRTGGDYSPTSTTKIGTKIIRVPYGKASVK